MSGIPEPGPLHGIRVADFGHKIAGPLTAVMLADQGADVVHVDAPRLGAAARRPGADAREVLRLAGRAELAGRAGPVRTVSELEQLGAVQATGLPAGWEQ